MLNNLLNKSASKQETGSKRNKRADVSLLRQVRFFECIQPKLFNLCSAPFIPNSVLCPVTALQNYFHAVPSQTDSPLFVVNHCGSLEPILAAHFNRLFKSCVAIVSINPSCFSSRSFRHCGATFAFNCGAPTEFIQAQGDWRSDAYLVYPKLPRRNSTSCRLFPLVFPT